MSHRLLAVVFLAALATIVACTTDQGGNTCVASPIAQTCGGGGTTTQPPASSYESLGTWHRFVRNDGSDDPNLEWALMEEPVPVRGGAFIVSGCPNPCMTLRVNVRMADIPNDPFLLVSVAVKTSINGISEADGTLGGFSVKNGENHEYYTSRLYYVANTYKWLLLQAQYRLNSTIPGGSTTGYSAIGKIFVDYGSKP